MYNLHPFKHWLPKVLCLWDPPFRGDLGQGWNNKLKSLPRYWRRLKAYFVTSPDTWINWTVLQACKRGKGLTAPHRWKETPLPLGHSHLLLRADKGQTQESTLSIAVCLIRTLRGSHQMWNVCVFPWETKILKQIRAYWLLKSCGKHSLTSNSAGNGPILL